MYTILVFRENKHIMKWAALTNCILTSIKYSAQSVFLKYKSEICKVSSQKYCLLAEGPGVARGKKNLKIFF